jgi:hypothetical protein
LLISVFAASAAGVQETAKLLSLPSAISNASTLRV